METELEHFIFRKGVFVNKNFYKGWQGMEGKLPFTSPKSRKEHWFSKRYSLPKPDDFFTMCTTHKHIMGYYNKK